MSLSFEFCQARADAAATAAQNATLDNVRDRELRSEAAWLEMANRLHAVQNSREQARLERAQALAESIA